MLRGRWLPAPISRRRSIVRLRKFCGLGKPQCGRVILNFICFGNGIVIDDREGGAGDPIARRIIVTPGLTIQAVGVCFRITFDKQHARPVVSSGPCAW